MSRLAHLDLLQSAPRLLVAYSGGLDSTVLLHQLSQWQKQHPQTLLRAMHIHHGLSVNAESWVAHCQRQCAEWQIPLIVQRVDIDPREAGIEGAARAARYAAFKQALLPGEALVTAQHQDDQTETLLLALKRGSGPAGLAAMPAALALGEHQLLRPLLSLPRVALERWANEYQLCWVEDESNSDTRYDRNFLRQQILPLLEARWPHFSGAAARSAALCGEQEALLNELLAESLTSVIADNGALRIPPLLSMSAVRRNALLRRWIALQNAQMPSREALNRLWQEVVMSRADAAPRLRFGQCEVRRYREALYWLPPLQDLRECVIPWSSPWQPLALPDRLGCLQQGASGPWLRKPQRDEEVTVRFQAQGYHHLVGRNGGRSMKKLWQELAVPPWQRDRTPLIYYNQQLIAAPGLFVTEQGQGDEQSGWQVCWQQCEQ